MGVAFYYNCVKKSPLECVLRVEEKPSCGLKTNLLLLFLLVLVFLVDLFLITLAPKSSD